METKGEEYLREWYEYIETEEEYVNKEELIKRTEKWVERLIEGICNQNDMKDIRIVQSRSKSSLSEMGELRVRNDAKEMRRKFQRSPRKYLQTYVLLCKINELLVGCC